MTDDADLAAFERTMHNRRMAISVLTAIAIGALLVWRLSGLFGHGDALPDDPPGLEVIVDASGHVTVPGCATDLPACIAAAHDREYHRPGGGHYHAVVRVAAGAPRDAVAAVRGMLLRGNFTPIEN